MTIYNPKYETMAREELQQLQIERLQTTLYRAGRNVAFYRTAFETAGIDVETVRETSDIRRLPFTTRDDLATSYPYGMFAVPLRDIVRIQATSGTTGKPIAVGYTKNDILHWSDLVARQLAAVGITDHDVVQIAFNYGLFTGGLGFHYGAERIGASVIPASSGKNVREQVMIMRDYKATALVTMPNHAASIANAIEEMDVHPGSLQLRVGMFGAEPWSETLRTHLEARLHLTAYDTYGLSEVMGPGIAAECTERNGMHVNEDHFIVEIINTATLEPVQPGEEGELVFTTITKEGFPVIRYRTRDLARFIEGTCSCGRTSARISRIAGRSDDMIIIRGAKVLPSQIQEVLLAVMGNKSEYRIVLDKKNDIDTLEVRIALSDTTRGFDDLGALERFRREITGRIADTFDIEPIVTFVEAGLLSKEDPEKKSNPVIDNRNR
jgi:phenylacetate-CoA ligase